MKRKKYFKLKLIYKYNVYPKKLLAKYAIHNNINYLIKELMK